LTERCSFHPSNLITLNDNLAQKIPDYNKIGAFLEVTECAGKPAVEDTANPSSAVSDWPTSGEIEIEDAVFHYATGRASALSGVSCSIAAGEKIGVCGKTGSGKSTLVNLLFRLGPLTSGSVKIAGQDLASVSVADVRSGVAIVPQSPTLFDGSIRENLVGGNRGTAADEWLKQCLQTCRLPNLAESDLDGSVGTTRNALPCIQQQKRRFAQADSEPQQQETN